MACLQAFLRLKKAALGVIVHLQGVQSSLPPALQVECCWRGTNC